jgi:hypothetical protein
MILDATTKSLEFVLDGAVSANEAEFTAYYADKSSTVFTPGTNDGTSNGATHVTWVAAPSASQQRLISELSLYNSDTAQIVVTVKLNNNGTRRTMFTVTLETEEQLLYTSESGWLVYDSNGTTKENSGAPFDAQYVLLGTNTTLTQERVLTGTSNQITITDNGAGNTVVLSAPQDLTVGGIALTDITQITNRSHTNLSDIGTNTHVQIDTHIAGTLAQHAATTSAQLAGVISDETGSGSLVFATSPTLVTPILGDATATSVTLTNTGLHLLDTNASHDLVIAPGSDLTADRQLTLTTGDAARTITLSGNPTLADWFDQNVKTTGTPTFAQLNVDNLRLDGNILSSVSGALTLTPLAGQNLNISLSTTGDFAVNTNQLYVDTSTGYVGIGTTPGAKLDVYGTGNERIYIRGTGTQGGGIKIIGANGSAAQLIVRDSPANGDLEFIDSDFANINVTIPNLGGLIVNRGNVGIGISTGIDGKTHIAQSSTTAAIPVLTLDQADVDEDFFKFIGTSDTNVDRALVDAADFTTPGSIVGWLKINIRDDQATNPIADGDYYLPFYSAPSA